MKARSPTRTGRTRARRSRQSHLDELISTKLEEIEDSPRRKPRKTGNIIIVVNHFHGDTNMSADTYKGNIGFQGPGSGANASGTVFNTVQKQSFSDIDLMVLSTELERLRHVMLRELAAADSSEPDQAIAIAAVANAEKAAKAGDAPATLTHLKAAGKWAWDTATKIGVSVAAKAIEGAMGLP
jgi:hypothetical protein